MNLQLKFIVGILCISLSFCAECLNPIYCDGPVLKTIQLSGIFNDSKTFVDMPLKFSPDIVLKNFNQLSDHSNATLIQFIQKNFYQPSSDIYQVIPTDWIPNPQFLNNIYNPNLKKFGAEVHALWKNFVRMFNHSFSCQDCFSSIMSQRPFVIPGGRFNEYYYWDNYWIVLGLLVSEMYDTALNVTYNILDNIKNYGYMPNGARIYYLMRSQPPVATLIVQEMYETLIKIPSQKNKANQLLKDSYELLKNEYKFWMKERIKAIRWKGFYIKLNVYDSNLTHPRPESYREDYNLHIQNPQVNEFFLYKELGAGAESGWDFSTRWFKNTSDFASIHTNEIFPVDLNVILLKVEDILSRFANILEKPKDVQEFQAAFRHRSSLIDLILYNNQSNQWADFILSKEQQQNNFYVSNFATLWANLSNQTNANLDKILDSLEKFINQYVGGIPTSQINSSQQWDFPNVWPPTQFIIIQGLLKINSTKAQNLAKQLSYKYVLDTYCGWQNTQNSDGEGYMFEKYDALEIGQPGGGGEYQVQSGFGWSNGVLLKILQIYGNQITELQMCPSYPSLQNIE